MADDVSQVWSANPATPAMNITDFGSNCACSHGCCSHGGSVVLALVVAATWPDSRITAAVFLAKAGMAWRLWAKDFCTCQLNFKLPAKHPVPQGRPRLRPVLRHDLHGYLSSFTRGGDLSFGSPCALH